VSTRFDSFDLVLTTPQSLEAVLNSDLVPECNGTTEVGGIVTGDMRRCCFARSAIVLAVRYSVR
jgi:hypothetical protein